MEPSCGRRTEFPGWCRLDLTTGSGAQFPAKCGLEVPWRGNGRGLDCPTRRWLNAFGRRLRHSFETFGSGFRLGQRSELRPGLHALRALHLALHANLLTHRGCHGLGGLMG